MIYCPLCSENTNISVAVHKEPRLWSEKIKAQHFRIKRHTNYPEKQFYTALVT